MENQQQTVTLEDAFNLKEDVFSTDQPKKRVDLRRIFLWGAILLCSIVTEFFIIFYGNSGNEVYLTLSVGLTIGVVILVSFLMVSFIKWQIGIWRGNHVRCGDFWLELPPIGRGGVGKVYRAKKKGAVQITHALKLISLDQFEGDSHRIRKIMKEPRILSSLNHPNIIKIIDVGRDRDAVFIVMEYVYGLDLGRVMKEIKDAGKELPPKYAVKIAIALCSGLDHAFKNLKNFIHRDIKPANIMIGYEGEIKILDFGIAKAQAYTLNTDKARGITGTIPYMSPEQIVGETIDIRSDIFSTGTVLYEMLSGELPFKGRNLSEVISKICCKEPVSVSELRSDIDSELEIIVNTALKKDPEKRFQTPGELLDLLEKYAADHSLFASDSQLSRFMDGNLAEHGNYPGDGSSQNDSDQRKTVLMRLQENWNFIRGCCVFFIFILQIIFFSFQIAESMYANGSFTNPEGSILRKIGKITEKIYQDRRIVVPEKSPLRKRGADSNLEQKPEPKNTMLVASYKHSATEAPSVVLQKRKTLDEADNSKKPPLENEGGDEPAVPSKTVNTRIVVPSPPKECHLTVTTVPATVTLMINDRTYRKKSTELLLDLESGQEYRLRIFRKGYFSLSEMFECLPEKKLTIRKVLSKKPRKNGALRIETIPAGAKVRVNGTLQKLRTPIEIQALPIRKNYKIEVGLTGFKTQTHTVALNKYSRLTFFQWKLVPLKREIQIRFVGKLLISGLKMDGVAYFLRDKNSRVKRMTTASGTTVFLFSGIMPGSHQVELIPNYPDKYTSQTKDVVFEPETVIPIKINDFLVSQK